MAVVTPGPMVTKVRVSRASKGQSSRRRSWSEDRLWMEKAQQGGWEPFGAMPPPSPWPRGQVFEAPGGPECCRVGLNWRTCERVIYRKGTSTPIFPTADPGLLEGSVLQAPALPGCRGY